MYNTTSARFEGKTNHLEQIELPKQPQEVDLILNDMHRRWIQNIFLLIDHLIGGGPTGGYTTQNCTRWPLISSQSHPLHVDVSEASPPPNEPSPTTALHSPALHSGNRSTMNMDYTRLMNLAHQTCPASSTIVRVRSSPVGEGLSSRRVARDGTKSMWSAEVLR
jgi:hypothetical protein